MESANQIRKKLIKQHNLENLTKYDSLFPFQIQKKGDELYKDNKIKNYKHTKSIASCTITGTEKYNLSIKFDEEDNIINMKCTCPYFKKGNNCKHLYALLIKSKLSSYYDVLKQLEKEKITQAQNIFNSSVESFLDDIQECSEFPRERMVEFVNYYRQRIPIEEKKLDEDMSLFQHLQLISEIELTKQNMIDDYNSIKYLIRVRKTNRVSSKKTNHTSSPSIIGSIFGGIIKGLFSATSTKSNSDYAISELKNGNPEPYVHEKGYLPDDIVEKYPIEFDDEDYYN